MIEAIIFDLGGVIINLDYQRTIDAFSQLAGVDVSVLYTQHHQVSLFDEYETGRIDSAAFRRGLRELLSLDCGDGELDAAWNAMLLDIPVPRIERLVELGRQVPIFLLSNTNEIHKAECDRRFQTAMGDPEANLSSLFRRAYYSHEVGDRKPNPSIFRRVLEEEQLNPATTLFIEDTAQHIAGAQQVGLQTIQVHKELTILDLDLGMG
jgi:FMN phosphatase YigB (HAD superfamily)